jgi:ubiquinol-cytochrome c reductase cytochrome b subunit
VKAAVERFLRDRGLAGNGSVATIAGGASFAYAFGSVLAFLVVVQAVTGVALAAFYAPSATDAWASVAYVQDQATLGWLVRGLHYHGASAIVIIAGLHLVQTAIYGAYKKPRELVWWLGIVLMLLMLAWAVTGFVLRWDQAGFWANKVEVGIAAATPVLGDAIKKLALGGNDYGNLTLTRFYALHVMVLPIITGGAIAAHIWLARKLGPTPLGDKPAPSVPRWPEQTLRNTIAIAVVFAILLAYVVSVHGVDLTVPADPSQAFDARPLWYFRALFELRQLAGSAEKAAAMIAPAIIIGALVALPLVDSGPSRAPGRRLVFLGGLAGLLAVLGALTLVSLMADAGNDELAKREAKIDQRAVLARKLARENGVPVTGAADVFMTSPMAKGRSLFAARCKSCHDAGSKDRKGPIIAPGHGSRAWIAGMLKNPDDDAYWGRTKLSKTEGAMKSFSDMKSPDLEDAIELMYAESGATDAVPAKRDRGQAVFETACSDCHAREEGVPGASAPGLAGLNTRDYYLSFISNPKSALHMGHDKSQMPRFDRELTLVERDALAEYLVWLRTATAADLAALDPY